MESKRCTQCGVELIAEGEGVLCPACLLESGLMGYTDASLSDLAAARVAEGATGPIRAPASDPIRDFGDYELLAEIARGGQGVVYRARHKGLNRVVALKMIALGAWATEANLKRFRTEAEAAANLDHPQIVPIYEIGNLEGQHYFTMKLIEGNSLKQLLAGGPLPARRAAQIVATVARAIHHAHQRGILHRDLKPGNILLDAKGQPHVTDFGLAKLIENESTVTKSADLLGTPSYMSPEQAAGQANKLTQATDVYGLGTVLYESITGNPPFAGGTTFETVRQVLEKEPRRPRLWNPKVDRDLETICLKCLEKDPARRFSSAEALAEDLERWLGHLPIRARPTGPIPRAAKWIRRNPAPAVLILTMVALVTAIAVIVWQRASDPGAGAGRLKSLAVVLRSGDTDSSSLAKECSRDLNHLLSRVSAQAGIVPRSEVLKWEASNDSPLKIATALGVNSVLLGTVARRENDFRLDIELVASPSGARLWSRTWTNLERNWPSVQTQIARDLVTKLGLTLTDKEQSLLRRPLTTNQAALDEYFLGRRALEVFTDSNEVKAVHHFEQAIHHDQNFAQAHAGLAVAHIYLGYNFQEPTGHFLKARTSINAALELDDTLPEAKIANGLLKYFYEWDWQGAERAVDEALRLDPSVVEGDYCYLHALDVLGRGDDALRQVQRACALFPSSPTVQSELACAAYYAGHLQQAVDYCRGNLKTDPENANIYWSLGRTLAQQTAYADALATLRTAKTKTGGEWPVIDAEIAYIHARQGETNQARRIIEQLRARERSEFVDPYIYAMIYAGTGDTEKVFEKLNLACDKKSSFLPSLPVDPKFTPLRSDRRYQLILTRLKLPATTIPATGRR